KLAFMGFAQIFCLHFNRRSVLSDNKKGAARECSSVFFSAGVYIIKQCSPCLNAEKEKANVGDTRQH
ncbi:MAG: hypothetical protein ACI4K7_02050, partial [Oscillospiraceae bacterium]